ncbi:hypothetical protein BGZ60DRAFT_436324 [Tricladium varicosporioides]|nr:hypothetical protein BGZ60DRAFT_436324 [Hymenoscyphus varicosporioides]
MATPTPTTPAKVAGIPTERPIIESLDNFAPLFGESAEDVDVDLDDSEYLDPLNEASEDSNGDEDFDEVDSSVKAEDLRVDVDSLLDSSAQQVTSKDAPPVKEPVGVATPAGTTVP